MSSAFVTLENCSIQDSISTDIWVSDPDSVEPDVNLLNTSFDESKVKITGAGSTLISRYHLLVMFKNEDGLPVQGASVAVTDNPNGTFSEIYITNSLGYIQEITLVDFSQTETEKIYFAPYNITASKANSLGWADPEVLLDDTFEIFVVMFQDSDGDEVFDKDDDFPQDATQSNDSDGDGYGDNPTGNDPDAFPLDALEWKDSDSDGIGDNADKFPQDATQWLDSDDDGYGDNQEGNNPDVFPDDPDEWFDSDSDGIGDNADEFPEDPDEWEDTDSDGVGDNSDFMPEFNNIIFFLLVGIVVIVVVLLLLLLTARRKRKSAPFEGTERSE
jgi:hypothetical protein